MNGGFPKELPPGWVATTVEEVCQHVTDGTHKTPDYKPTGVRFISIKNIRPFAPVDWGAYVRFISEDAHRDLTRRCKPEFDDIMFPRIGTLGFAKRVDFTEEVSLFVGLGLLKPERIGILPKYLEYYMNTPWIDRLSHERANGTGRLTLPLEETRRLPVLLAPLREQQRIVDELDELLSDLDSGVAALERVRDKLKLYRASVLKAAVEGALTAEWRRQHRQAEPSSDLLKRILAERRRRWEEEQLRKFRQKNREPPKNWKAKYKEPPPPDASDLQPLPEAWVYATVEQLGAPDEQPVLTGPFGTSLGRLDFVESGIPLLTIGCLTASGIRLDRAEFVASDKAAELSRYQLRKGDLLFSRMASVGRAGLVTSDRLNGALFNYHLMRLRLASAAVVCSYFLNYVRGASQVVRYLKKVNHGATRDGINTDQLLRLPIALPPLEEQLVIVEEADDYLSIVDHLEANVTAKLKGAQALRLSILRHAFSGKLVPQEPKDEPASELLTRIAAEREQRSREAAAAKRLNGQKPRRARARDKASGTVTKETDHGSIADR